MRNRLSYGAKKKIVYTPGTIRALTRNVNYYNSVFEGAGRYTGDPLLITTWSFGTYTGKMRILSSTINYASLGESASAAISAFASTNFMLIPARRRSLGSSVCLGLYVLNLSGSPFCIAQYAPSTVDLGAPDAITSWSRIELVQTTQTPFLAVSAEPIYSEDGSLSSIVFAVSEDQVYITSPVNAEPGAISGISHLTAAATAAGTGLGWASLQYIPPNPSTTFTGGEIIGFQHCSTNVELVPSEGLAYPGKHLLRIGLREDLTIQTTSRLASFKDEDGNNLYPTAISSCPDINGDWYMALIRIGSDYLPIDVASGGFTDIYRFKSFTQVNNFVSMGGYAGILPKSLRVARHDPTNHPTGADAERIIAITPDPTMPGDCLYIGVNNIIYRKQASRDSYLYRTLPDPEQTIGTSTPQATGDRLAYVWLDTSRGAWARKPYPKGRMIYRKVPNDWYWCVPLGYGGQYEVIITPAAPSTSGNGVTSESGLAD